MRFYVCQFCKGQSVTLESRCKFCGATITNYDEILLKEKKETVLWNNVWIGIAIGALLGWLFEKSFMDKVEGPAIVIGVLFGGLLGGYIGQLKCDDLTECAKSSSYKTPVWVWLVLVGLLIAVCVPMVLAPSKKQSDEIKRREFIEAVEAKKLAEEAQRQAAETQRQAEELQRRRADADSRAKQQSVEIQRIEDNIKQMQEQMKNMSPAQREQTAKSIVEQMTKSARMRSAADQQKGVSIPSPTPTVLMIPKGMFMVGNELYYSNGSAYCRYASWESFVALTGRRDVKGIQVYPTLPAKMIGGDTCRGY